MHKWHGSLYYYILVEAPLQVLHLGWGLVATTALGFASCCICHSTPPLVLYFIVQHKYMVLLLICWVCVGGLRGLFLAHSADSVSCHDSMLHDCCPMCHKACLQGILNI